MVSKLLAASYFVVLLIPSALPQHFSAPVHVLDPQTHDRSPHTHGADANQSSLQMRSVIILVQGS